MRVTFVIALSYFYVVVKSPTAVLPDIGANVLALLGISGASYVVAKGIQATKEPKSPDDSDDSAPPPNF